MGVAGVSDEELSGADAANGASVLAHLAHCEEKTTGALQLLTNARVWW